MTRARISKLNSNMQQQRSYSRTESDATLTDSEARTFAIKSGHDFAEDYYYRADQIYNVESGGLPAGPSRFRKLAASKLVLGAIVCFVLFMVVFEIKENTHEEKLALNSSNGNSNALKNQIGATNVENLTAVAGPHYAHHSQHSVGAGDKGKKGSTSCLGSYICLGLICTVRWAVCWNYFIKTQARAAADSYVPMSSSIGGKAIDSGVDAVESLTCCGIWKYIACGCSPPPFMDAAKDFLGCTVPCFWFMPWNWVSGPWGCCTITPCCFPWVDKCCGTVYPTDIWNKDAFTKGKVSTTMKNFTDAVGKAAVKGLSNFTPGFPGGK